MIVFDLNCANGHVFEVWFGSSASYEYQRARELIACALCGSTDVSKAVMAPRLNAKGNQRAPELPATSTQEGASPAATPPVAVTNAPAPVDPGQVRAVLQALAKAQAKVLEQSTWVGSDFANRARAMHYGEEDHAPIHGQAAPEEAAALIDEGVAVAPLPLPVIPPEAQN